MSNHSRHHLAINGDAVHRRAGRCGSSHTSLIVVCLIAAVIIGGILLLRRASRQALADETALLNSDNARQAMLLQAHRTAAANAANQAAQAAAAAVAAEAAAEAARLKGYAALTFPRTGPARPTPLRLTPGRKPIKLSSSSEPVSNEGAAPPPADPSTLKLDAMDRAGINLPPAALDDLERRGLLKY